MFERYFLHRQQRALQLLEGAGHLCQHGFAAGGRDHQVICQQHGEGFIAYQLLGAQHGMPEAQHAGLAYVGAEHVVRHHGTRDVEQRSLVAGLELVFQFIGRVEMIFDCTFVAPCHKNHVADTGGIGFLDRVLNQRLVHDGKHFLGLRLGGRQKARAQARNRKNGFTDTGH